MNAVIYSLHGDLAFLLVKVQALVMLDTIENFLLMNAAVDTIVDFLHGELVVRHCERAASHGVLEAPDDSALACVWAWPS